MSRVPRQRPLHGANVRRVVLLLGVLALALGLAGPGGARRDVSCPIALGKVVDIRGSGPEWRDCLVEALQMDNTTVRLGPDVDMDLTAVGTIHVAAGVTLMSVRSLPSSSSGKGEAGRGSKPVFSARSGNANGPRLYTKAHPKGLLTIECYPDGALNDNVHISGFRLIGPDYGVESSDDHLQIGILVINCKGVEISNMEIAGWSNQGIGIVDGPRFDGKGRIDKPEQVVVRGNYIHNNQHEGAEGYGVAMGLGATALIVENVFDSNRHSVEASGKSDGYDAERNLVLKGGGYHKLGFHTHVFDVHGDDNCGLRGAVNDSAWNCGRAGGWVAIKDNAFQYLSNTAVRIRGTPQVGGWVLHNVFAHSRLEETTLNSGAFEATTGKKNISLGKGLTANVLGYDSYGKYGICDFDGDGKDDLFLATGVSWWYSSSGEFQWTFLKQATERIDQVRLGYINGDNRCDVLAANGNSWEVAYGGTAGVAADRQFRRPDEPGRARTLRAAACRARPDLLRVPPRTGRPVVRDEPRHAELAAGAKLVYPPRQASLRRLHRGRRHRRARGAGRPLVDLRERNRLLADAEREAIEQPRLGHARRPRQRPSRRHGADSRRAVRVR